MAPVCRYPGQGWSLLLLGYIATLATAAYLFQDRLAVIFAIVVPTTLLLMLVAAKTTRGGWRWRWGKED